ncbi:MAG: PAS domain-containing sensor histidine kinase [Flavobacteriales bacterium]|nr:PAS domain-containing sensor histidine kinase [Flavobacteriales bacterium]
MTRAKQVIPQSQIDEISNLLLEYSTGNYSYQGKISPEFDEIDSIIEAVNMLGQELDATTVSRDYFMSIFNASSDFFVVVNDDGQIENGNTSICDLFKLDQEDFKEKVTVQTMFNDDFWTKALNSLKRGQGYSSETTLYADSKKIPVEIRCSVILNSYDKVDGYLIIAQDITERKNTERLILRKTFEAQQSEQKRVSQDLHDSIGQQLSALNLMISNLKHFINTDQNAKDLYHTCLEILKDTIQQLREISFDLMPSALEKNGLSITIEQLVKKLQKQKEIQFIFVKSGTEGNLKAELKQAVYRIIQEFINNSLKHSKANSVRTEIHFKKDKMVVFAQDDGVGFDIAKLPDGSGLNNFFSRVKAFGGNMNLESAINEGTRLTMEFETDNSEKGDENSFSG